MVEAKLVADEQCEQRAGDGAADDDGQRADQQAADERGVGGHGEGNVLIRMRGVGRYCSSVGIWLVATEPISSVLFFWKTIAMVHIGLERSMCGGVCLLKLSSLPGCCLVKSVSKWETANHSRVLRCSCGMIQGEGLTARVCRTISI
ncbi:hypothetical protein D3C76_1265490 [compost metagenome]